MAGYIRSVFRSPALRSFRRAVIRGLAVLTPPLLTVLIIIWAVNTTKSYLLEPVKNWAREGLLWSLADVREDLPLATPDATTADFRDETYRRLGDDTFIPLEVYERVRKNPGTFPLLTGMDYYRRYIDITYLRPYYAIPTFVLIFVLLLYLLGKFMAAGLGGYVAEIVERLVLRLPGVRAVYSAVKQVSDFLFNRRELQVTRIVAVEYPRKDIWSIGFVTSEGLATIHSQAAEPVLTVFVPYSPVPITGCTIAVRKSECIDLDMSFDQACQFIVSCGVVVPPQELTKPNEEKADDNQS